MQGVGRSFKHNEVAGRRIFLNKSLNVCHDLTIFYLCKFAVIVMYAGDALVLAKLIIGYGNVLQ